MEYIGGFETFRNPTNISIQNFWAFAGIHEYLRISFIKQKGTHKQRVRSSARNIKPIHPVSCFRYASRWYTTDWSNILRSSPPCPELLDDLGEIQRCLTYSETPLAMLYKPEDYHNVAQWLKVNFDWVTPLCYWSHSRMFFPDIPSTSTWVDRGLYVYSGGKDLDADN